MALVRKKHNHHHRVGNERSSAAPGVHHLQEGGLMEAWNFENPDLAVQPGDRFAEALIIVAVFRLGSGQLSWDDDFPMTY